RTGHHLGDAGHSHGAGLPAARVVHENTDGLVPGFREDDLPAGVELHQMVLLAAQVSARREAPQILPSLDRHYRRTSSAYAFSSSGLVSIAFAMASARVREGSAFWISSAAFSSFPHAVDGPLSPPVPISLNRSPLAIRSWADLNSASSCSANSDDTPCAL